MKKLFNKNGFNETIADVVYSDACKKDSPISDYTDSQIYKLLDQRGIEGNFDLKKVAKAFKKIKNVIAKYCDYDEIPSPYYEDGIRVILTETPSVNR